MFFIRTVCDWLRERSRQIFRYHDGVAWRRVDPIRVVRAVEEVCPDYADLLATLKTNTQEIPAGPLLDDMIQQQKKARDAIIAASRRVFGIAELNDSKGMTDAEAVGVFASFLAFMEVCAGEAELFRDSPERGAASLPASTTESCAASTTAAS